MNPTITEDDCKIILSKIHPESIPLLKNFEIKLAPNDQDGFFGDSHILNISYNIECKEEERTFFVKVFPIIPEIAEMARNLLAYEKEIFYYEFLIPEYKKMGLKTNFVPECYYFKMGKIIVMENLTVRNYITKYCFNLNESKNSLKSIAEMHAASILYEEKMSVLQKNFKLRETYSDIFAEKFFDLKNPKSFVYNHFKEGFKCVKELLQYIPQTEGLREDFLTKLGKIDFEDIFKKDLGFKKVCCHGDLWRRNILFQEKTNHCILIDFQMLRYFDPAFDVLSFLYFNVPINLLKIHREELLRYYYKCLSESTDALVERLLPYADFMRSVDHFEVLAIYQAAVGHTLDITENVNDMFFGNRVKYCCLEFKKNKIYRDTLVNDIMCLIDYVLKTNYS